jgi:sulfoacetaldehyde acetyltransferase
MAELARRCFSIAKSENGPTQLNIPRDYFYGLCEDEIYATPEVRRGPGPRAQIQQAAKMLAKARYPVILAGGGVSQGLAHDEARALAEFLTAPVVNSYLHNDSFPADHPLAAGPIGYCGSKAAMRTIAKADLVLALGSRLGPFGTLPQYDMEYFPRKAKIIQVDVDHRVLGLSRRVDLGVCGDCGAFAAEVLQALKDLEPAASRSRTAWTTWPPRRPPGARNWKSGPRHGQAHAPAPLPARAVRGHPQGLHRLHGHRQQLLHGQQYLKFSGPRQHVSALSWGNCGFAYGAALGCRIGRPETPVFALQGDGAYGISGLAEVMTAVRENIPVIAVVFQNYEWGAEKKNQIDYYDNRFVGSNLRENPSYAQLAKDMGAEGYRVEDYTTVRDVVRTAVASGRPTVIEAVVEGGKKVLAEPFRRDALQMPVRHLPKYAHLNAKR